MVIGTGLIAKAFKEYRSNNDVIIFASGVSDSKTDDENEFKKELDLLKNTIKNNSNKTLIYFSTTSILDPSLNNSAYCIHKIRIEEFIKKNCVHYLILRVSNVIGETGNPKTIFNFLKNKINNGESFFLWENAKRNLIDIDDLFLIVKGLLNDSREKETLNITGPFSLEVLALVQEIEKHLNKKAVFEVRPFGKSFSVDSDIHENDLTKFGVKFDKDYYQRIILKYVN